MIDNLIHIPALPPSYAKDSAQNLTQAELRHLAACPGCRESLLMSRRLAGELNSLNEMSVPSHVWENIERRLASGERFVLPDAISQTPKRSMRWMSAAAILATGVSVWLLWPTRNISASSSGGELQFAGDFGSAQTIAVTYTDHGLFRTDPSLRVRARFRTIEGEEYNDRTPAVVVTTLRRDGDDFKGSFVVPNGVVFGAFAIEDGDGARVDANGGRLWTKLASSRDGRPTFEALTQAFYDAMGVSLEAALVILQDRAKAYPDRVDGWGEVVAYEGFMLGQAHTDSGLASHMQRLRRFDDQYKRRPAVPLDVADGLRGYAVQLHFETNAEAGVIAKFWDSRARRATGKSRWSTGRRLSTFVPLAKKSPKAALDSMETAWQDGDSSGNFVGNGVSFAIQANDSVGLDRWTKKYDITNRRGASFAYAGLLDKPNVRELGLNGLRRTLRYLYTHDERWRPLDKSVTEYARSDSASAGEILAKIAEGLRLSGARKASLDTFAIATETGWNPSLFKLAGNAFMNAGDTARAQRLYAMVAADPNYSDSASIFATGKTRWDSGWPRLIDNARNTMLRRILADAVSRPLPLSPRIVNQEGRVDLISTFAGGKVHVVTFWSRYCAPSRRDFAQLNALGKALSKHGIVLIPIAQESPSASVRSFVKEQKVTVPVYYDAERQAGRAFNQWRTPDYYVVDQEGVIRFAHSDIDKILAQAVALSAASAG